MCGRVACLQPWEQRALLVPSAARHLACRRCARWSMASTPSPDALARLPPTAHAPSAEPGTSSTSAAASRPHQHITKQHGA